MRIRALVLRQPWATLVATGEKLIETRRWKTPYRGPVLIIAGQHRMTRKEETLLYRRVADPWDCPLGAAVATCTLIDVVPYDSAVHREKACLTLAAEEYFQPQWAWLLMDVRRLDPFPMKGQLGLYSVEIEDSRMKGVQR
jgi:hypothetical protein